MSPLLANIYLDDLDGKIAEAGLQMVRYADDFVILSRTEQEAQRALALVSDWMERAELQLHPQKTKIVDATQKGGFEFLGYHFERGQKWPRKKSEVKVREKLRKRTRRTNGQSLQSIIAGINPILRGGLTTSSTANSMPSKRWIVGSEDACEASCENEPKGRGRPKGSMITPDGATASLTRPGCST